MVPTCLQFMKHLVIMNSKKYITKNDFKNFYKNPSIFWFLNPNEINQKLEQLREHYNIASNQNSPDAIEQMENEEVESDWF